MKEITNIELIERYIDGELNSTDATAFEKQIEADPKLKNEVIFQKDMISALQNARRSDLKARLAAIEVSAGFSNIQRFAIAASTLIVGSMIYFGVSEMGTQTEITAETSDEIENITPVVTENIEVTPTNNVVNVVENTLDESVESVEVPKNQNTTVNTNQVTTSNDDLTTAPIIPGIPMDEEDELSIDNIDNEPKGASHLTTRNVVANSGVPIPKMHSAKKKGQLAYEYDKENLDLYGDFNKEYYLYELTGTGNIYLLFNDMYYEITETKSKTPLKEVQDLSIIESLNSQR
jgi:hypothetical protein